MNGAFIFDWSGTLIDNFQCFCQACGLMFKDLGREPISEEEIRSNFTLPYMKFWNRYFPNLSKEDQCELYEKYIHQVGEPKLFEDVAEMLTLIHDQGWRLFILSSDPISKLIIEIENSAMSHLFEKIVGNVHEKGGVIRSLVNEFNLNESEVYYVGDTSGDIEAGKFANVKTIGISWGFQDKNKLSDSKPDFLIDNILEIRKLFLARAGEHPLP